MVSLFGTQKSIREFCLREVFRNETPAPVLMRGGPGTGKRTIARAMADKAGIPFVEIPLAGPSEFLRKRLFGSEAECLRSKDTHDPPGELSSLDNHLVYFSDLQGLSIDIHQDFQKLVTRRTYSDLNGREWRLPQGLIIVVSLTEGVEGNVTPTHWLCRQFSAQIMVDVPHAQKEAFGLIQEIIRNIQPDCKVELSESEAVTLLSVAQWNLRTLREWIQGRMTMRSSSGVINYNDIREVIEKDVGCLLSRMEYCATCVPLDRYRNWSAQFPPKLASVPIHIVRKIYDAYYISAAEFQAGIHNLIRKSKITADGKVVFCKWQYLGKSAPMVTHELKNRGRWKLIGELDLDRDLETWPKLRNETGVSFILADDFVGSGKTFKKLLTTGSVKKLVEHYSEASVKILIVAAYEEPLSEIARTLRVISDRIDIQVHKLFFSKDRCFTDDSLIFASDEERNDVKRFCCEMAEKHFPRLRNHPFGFGGVASLCVFHNTVPNNSLPILWFDDNQREWTPLFPARGLQIVDGVTET